jgi:hypothetical protein
MISQPKALPVHVLRESMKNSKLFIGDGSGAEPAWAKVKIPGGAYHAARYFVQASGVLERA